MSPEDSVLAFEDQQQAVPETVDETVIGDAAGDDVSNVETERDGSQAGAQFDWESDNNPYKKRLGGAQGRIQELVEAQRAEQARRIELENSLFEQQIAGLDPVDQAQARQNLIASRQFQQTATQQQAQQAQLNELAREIVTSRIAQSYSVPVKELAQFDDPYAMEQYARAVSDVRRTQRKETRRVRQADKFESSASVSQQKVKQYGGDLDAAAFDFANLRLPRR